jgi:[ribosomal protein S5]-alanine N-acetyltransferase
VRLFNRLELRIATENKASEKVALKVGFKYEGTNREAAYSKGKLYDMNIYMQCFGKNGHLTGKNKL